jgi:catecholate siderophore receptor
MKKLPILLMPAVVQALTAYAPFAFAEEQVLKTVSVRESGEKQPDQAYRAKRSTTATKTDTALIDVPQSISVIGQELIKDQAVQNMADAVRYVPGVTASQGEGNRDALNFRGAGVSTGDFYIDGVRDDIQTYRDFYNIERIDVLKGPNGMIFGRGTAGGAINRVSKEAGWTPVREISASVGMWDHKRAALDVGAAINDMAAMRLNAVYEDSGSYRDGVELKRRGITPTFTLYPGAKTKVVLGAEYFKDEHVGDRGVPSQAQVGTNLNNRPYRIEDYDTFYGNAKLSPNETETTAFNALIEHEFSQNLLLRNRTRYADYDKFYQNVYTRSAVSTAGTFQFGAYRDETDRDNLINQTDLIYDVQLAGMEHKLLFGMELGKQDTDNQRITPVGGENLSGSYASPKYPNPVAFTNASRDRSSETDIAAFYLQDQVALSSQWLLVLGARHDKFEVDHTNRLTGDRLNTSDNLLSPRAGLIFKPVDNLSLYASYSQTYVPRAGDQLIDLTPVNSSFDPEKFVNKEIGAKWDVTPELALTVAIYELDRQKMAVADPNNPTQNILVDGQQTQGVELGAAGKITPQWSIFGGYAYQDGEITDQQNTGGAAILKGAELAQTPDHQFSLWNRYDFNTMWGAGLGVISRSEMYAAVPTATTSTVLPGYTRFDAAVYLALSKALKLQLNLENLTDKRYALNAHNNNNITPASPRAARVAVNYLF